MVPTVGGLSPSCSWMLHNALRMELYDGGNKLWNAGGGNAAVL